MPLLLETDTGSAQDITSENTLASHTNSTGLPQLVALDGQLTSLNGAAADITMKVMVGSGMPDQLISSKAADADTVLHTRLMGEVYLPDGDTIDWKVTSTNGSDTSVSFTARWLDVSFSDSPDVLANTTIASYTSQTLFTLTTGPPDDDALNGATAVITDQTTNTQKQIGIVSDYTGSSKTVTLESDPGVFTFAQDDLIVVIAGASNAADIADAVWDEAQADHVASGSFGEMATNLPDVLSLANINVQVDTALSDIGLHYLITGAIPTDLDTDVHDDSLLGYIMATSVMLGWNRTTDSMQAHQDGMAATVWTTALTEAYGTDGSNFTGAQGLYMLWASLSEFSISSTTITAKQLDGSTTAMTFTLDDATNPTSRTRAT